MNLPGLFQKKLESHREYLEAADEAPVQAEVSHEEPARVGRAVTVTEDDETGTDGDSEDRAETQEDFSMRTRKRLEEEEVRALPQR